MEYRTTIDNASAGSAYNFTIEHSKFSKLQEKSSSKNGRHGSNQPVSNIERGSAYELTSRTERDASYLSQSTDSGYAQTSSESGGSGNTLSTVSTCTARDSTFQDSGYQYRRRNDISKVSNNGRESNHDYSTVSDVPDPRYAALNGEETNNRRPLPPTPKSGICTKCSRKRIIILSVVIVVVILVVCTAIAVPIVLLLTNVDPPFTPTPGCPSVERVDLGRRLDIACYLSKSVENVAIHLSSKDNSTYQNIYYISDISYNSRSYNANTIASSRFILNVDFVVDEISGAEYVEVKLIVGKSLCEMEGTSVKWMEDRGGSNISTDIGQTNISIVSHPAKPILERPTDGFVEGSSASVTCQADIGCPGPTEDITLLRNGVLYESQYSSSRTYTDSLGSKTVRYTVEFKDVNNKDLHEDTLQCRLQVEGENYQSSVYTVYVIARDFCNNKELNCNHQHPYKCDRYVTCIGRPVERLCSATGLVFRKPFGAECHGECVEPSKAPCSL